MGIYNSNNFDTVGSVRAGLEAARDKGKLMGDKKRALAEEYRNNAGAISKLFGDMGNVGLNAYDMYQEQNDTPEARLAALESELAEAQHIKDVQDKYNSQVVQRKRVNDYLLNGINTDTFRKPEIPVTYGPSLAETYANDMQGYRPADTGYSTYIHAINSAPGVYPEIEDEYRRGIY